MKRHKYKSIREQERKQDDIHEIDRILASGNRVNSLHINRIDGSN